MKFHEAIIQALAIQAEGVKVKVIAMQAFDATHAPNGGGYTEEAYDSCSKTLFAISDEIQQIARSGVLS